MTDDRIESKLDEFGFVDSGFNVIRVYCLLGRRDI